MKSISYNDYNGCGEPAGTGLKCVCGRKWLMKTKVASLHERNAYWNGRFKEGQVYGTEPSKIIQVFSQYLDKRWGILELGGGGGRDSAELARRGFRNLTCTDVSENAIELAKKSFPGLGVKFEVKEDIMRLGYPEGSFDAVFSVYLMSLFKEDERNGIFQQSREILVPNGRFCNNFLALDDWERKNGRLVGDELRNPEGAQIVHFFSKREVMALHERNGYRIIDMEKVPERRLLFGEEHTSRSWAVVAEKVG
jgi:SAM-dependent methyltransferase